jgi:hypothetical protein
VKPENLGTSLSWISDSSGSTVDAHLALLREQLKEADTLEELGDAALDYLIVKCGLSGNQRAKLALASRLRWVNGKGATLRESAMDANLTSERVRQLQQQLGDLHVDPPVNSALCHRLITASDDSGDVRSFLHSLQSRGIADPTNEWSVDSVGELIGVIGGVALQSEFLTSVARNEPYVADSKTKAIIRRVRTPIGLIDTNALAIETNLPILGLIEAIRQTYPLVYESNSLVLAIQQPPGTFIRTIGSQLLIQDGLSPDEVLEGINRQIDSRQETHVGTHDALSGLIETIAGNPCLFANLPDFAQETIELIDSQIWFREIFHNSATGLLHRDQIAEAALEDGISLGSIGAWTSYSPILRKAALGVYCLVGTQVPSEDAEMYRAGAVAVRSQSTFDFDVLSSNLLQLRIRPSFGTFEGGSFFARSELCDLIADFEFRSECQCGDSELNSKIRLSPSKFLIGFAQLLTHARESHEAKVGDELIIILNFSTSAAQLQALE